MTLDVVCFDLYETLITEFWPGREPLPDIAPRLGVELGAFHVAWRQSRHERHCGGIPDYPTALRHICASLGVVADEGVIAALHAERVAFKAIPFARISDPVFLMIRYLHERGIRLAVISNAAREEIVGWGRCALRPLFDAALFSCDLGCAKPEAAIYRAACCRLGTEPERILFVGDGGSDELAGARAAGMYAMRAVWYLKRQPGWNASTGDGRFRDFPAARDPADVVTFVTEHERNR